MHDTPTEEPTRHVVRGGTGKPKTGTLTMAKRAMVGRPLLDIDADGTIEPSDLHAAGQLLRWALWPLLGLAVLLCVGALVMAAYDFELTVGGESGLKLSAQSGSKAQQVEE